MTDEERLAEIAKDAEHPWETEGAKIWNEKVKFLLGLLAARDREIAEAMGICDSYAEENQRISDERDAALAQVAQLKNALDLHAIAWTQGIPNYCLELAAERDAALAQVAALREALRQIAEKKPYGAHDVGSFVEIARAALDDGFPGFRPLRRDGKTLGCSAQVTPPPES